MSIQAPALLFEKFIAFVKKHKFPKHFFGVHDILAYLFSRTVSTAFAKILLKIQGAMLGSGAIIDGSIIVRCEKSGSISIGDNLKINSRQLSNLVGLNGPAIFQCSENGRIQIGNNCGLSSSIMSSRDSITIGNNAVIGANVRILDHDFHSLNYLDRRNLNDDKANCKKRAISIGDDVFIGINSIILKGVKLGDRVIVGANSVVTLNDVPSDSLIAGNPARIISQFKVSNKTS